MTDDELRETQAELASLTPDELLAFCREAEGQWLTSDEVELLQSVALSPQPPGAPTR